MRPRLLAVVSLVAALGCAARPPTPHAPPPAVAPAPQATAPAVPLGDEPVGRLPDGVTPLRYALTLDIDPAGGRFHGEVDITTRLEARRDGVWMHGHGLDVTRAEVRRGDAPPLTARWVRGTRDGIASLRWDTPLDAGDVTLHLVFEAPLNRHLEGLYRVESGGDAYAFTQFEALSARKAFPCFDEPRFKTPFDITLVVARDHQAITNTAEREVSDRDDGRRVHRFAATEALPTYLLAFAVGPLEVVEAPPLPPNEVRQTPIPLRGIAARGRGRYLQRALPDAAPLVAAMERYFARAYPYPKLDLIAVPDFAAGAMENAGAITFREPALLVRPDAPLDQMRRVDAILAHELAHHWFGNLVTLRWWDDIWLNESFATWMGTRMTHEVFPEHRADIGLVADGHNAMGADALASAVSIRRSIERDDDLRGGSSAIVYAKGATVLAMLERWIGVDAFRDAIRAYLRAHEHGTAVSADLFRALAAASPEHPIDATLRTFIETPGVPTLAAELVCDAQGRRVTVTQHRFALPAGTQQPGGPWAVPVCVRFPEGATTSTRCALIEAAEGSVDLGSGPCPAWVMPNADARGYYRWSLSPARLAALVTQGWSALTPGERLAVVNNARAAFTAGTLDFAALRPVLSRAAHDDDRVVALEPLPTWTRIVEDELTGAAAERARRAVVAEYAPRYRALGWTRSPNEPVERTLLRRDLVYFLGLVADDAAVRAEGARLGTRWLASNAGGGVPSDLVGPALAMLLRGADDATVARVVTTLVESDDAVLRFRLINALGQAPARALTDTVLPLTLDPRLRVNEVFSPIHAAAGRSAVRDAAFRWFVAHVDGVFARISLDGRGGTPWIASRFCSHDDAERARAFFAPRIAEVHGAEAQLRGAIEAIEVCAAERDAQAQGLARAFGATAR